MLEKTKDLVVNEIEKRFKNPFLGAFIISWLFFNWDFIYVVLFLDEKYVSLIPELWNFKNIFITKIEYIKTENILNINKSFWFPLALSFLFVIFVEWFTTFFNIWLDRWKNWIKDKELLSVEESIILKNKLVDSQREFRKNSSLLNEEILSLETENSEIKLKINDKVNEKLNEHQKLNLKRIKELEKNLDNSNKISNERLEENKKIEEFSNRLEKNNRNLLNEREINSIKISKLISSNDKSILELNKIRIEKSELEDRLRKIDKPLDEKYIDEYNQFKESHFFNIFWRIIDEIESNSYSLNSNFNWKDLKYLKVKNIIGTKEDADYNWNPYDKYFFTNKWNKFVEFFLEEYKWDDKNENSDVSIEDLPF